MVLSANFDFSFVSLAGLITVTVALGLALRIFQNLYLHPLASFPGPWYAASFSLVNAIVSLRKEEPEWLLGLVKKYGSNTPIRISPSMLLFPRPSALRDIYWDPACNKKSGLYGTGALGPPNVFTTLDGRAHKELRKALSNAPWSTGQLKNTWEPRIDDQINLFVQKMTERAKNGDIVCLSDKVAEFAADIMTMISFTTPFGFVKNSRDEKEILTNWRKSLDFFGFVGRFTFLRNHVLNWPVVGPWLLPKPSQESGAGWLMYEADRQVTEREKSIKEQAYEGQPDFLQHCLEARINGKPLDPIQKRAHVTILIMAGADTTGTALGSTLRFLVTHPEILQKAREEIEEADKAGKLSSPVQWEESRVHLPYFVACIKESLRLQPPATNLFARVVPKEGIVIDGHFIPPDTEVTANAYVVQRDPHLYAPDPEQYRPERWLESQAKHNEMDNASFTFGVGFRVCMGKDIAFMELYKLLPEMVRRFDFDMKKEGEYMVAGGVAYNPGFLVQLKARDL